VSGVRGVLPGDGGRESVERAVGVNVRWRGRRGIVTMRRSRLAGTCEDFENGWCCVGVDFAFQIFCLRRDLVKQM